MHGRKTIRSLIAVLAILVLASAMAAGAGDDIKWTKSEKIAYYSPATDPSELGEDLSAIKSDYLLQWSPYFNNDIDDVLVRWFSWEWVATDLNRDLKNGAITRSVYDKEVIERRALTNQYLTFEIWIEAKNEKFYKSAGEGYWEFLLITKKTDLKPTDVKHTASSEATEITVDVGGEQHDIYDPGNVLMHRFEIRFDNPYVDADPEVIRLLLRSEKYSRGFEWRFREE